MINVLYNSDCKLIQNQQLHVMRVIVCMWEGLVMLTCYQY